MLERLRLLGLIWRIEWRVWRHPVSRRERKGWRREGKGWFGIRGFAANRVRCVEWDKHGLGDPPLGWEDQHRGILRKTRDLFERSPDHAS